jgi:hypothetical protein
VPLDIGYCAISLLTLLKWQLFLNTSRGAVAEQACQRWLSRPALWQLRFYLPGYDFE